MSPRFRNWALVLVGVLAAGAIALGVATSSADPTEPTAELEDSLEKVSRTVSSIEGRLGEVEVSDKGLASDLASLRTTLDELTEAIDGLSADIAALGDDVGRVDGQVASINSKLDSLDSKIASLDQQLWILESRYEDHLRKYHGS